MLAFSFDSFNGHNKNRRIGKSSSTPIFLPLSFIFYFALFSWRAAAGPVLLDSGYQLSTLASGVPFLSAGSITASNHGDIFVADPFGNGISGDRIFSVSSSGSVTTLATPATTAYLIFGDIEQDAAGNVYSFDVVENRLLKTDTLGNTSIFYTAVGGVGTPAGTGILGLTISSSGDLFAGSPFSQQILRIDSAGNATVFLDNAAVTGGLGSPVGMDFSASGDLFYADLAGRVVQVSPLGVANILVSSLPSVGSDLAIDPESGDLFITAGTDIYRVTTAGTVTTFANNFVGLAGLDFGLSSSGSGTSLYVTQFGLTTTASDGDAVFEIAAVPLPGAMGMFLFSLAGGFFARSKRKRLQSLSAVVKNGIKA